MSKIKKTDFRTTWVHNFKVQFKIKTHPWRRKMLYNPPWRKYFWKTRPKKYWGKIKKKIGKPYIKVSLYLPSDWMSLGSTIGGGPSSSSSPSVSDPPVSDPLSEGLGMRFGIPSSLESEKHFEIEEIGINSNLKKTKEIPWKRTQPIENESRCNSVWFWVQNPQPFSRHPLAVKKQRILCWLVFNIFLTHTHPTRE